METYLNDKKSPSAEKIFRLELSTTSGIVYVPAHAIIRCEAVSNYTRVYFTNGSPLLVCKTLLYFERRLATAGFIRIHRGELVNREFVAKYKRCGVLWLTDGSQLMVSKRKKRDFFMAIAC
jgi:two-component system, LytTR family, response regulator